MNNLFSVVVPVLNEEERVLALLKSVHGQTYRPIEVLVVDGGSTDRTVTRVAQFSEEKGENFTVIILKDTRNVSAARNLGIRASHGENVLLLDADILLSDSEILHQLNDALKSHDIAYFVTKTLVDSWLEYHLMLDSEAPLFGFITVAGWAFKRTLLDRVQFDDSLGFGEDRDFVNRLSTFVPPTPTLIRGIGFRHFPHDLSELRRQKLWYGRTVLVWIKKHHSLKELAVLSPLAALGTLVLLLPAFLISITLGVGLTIIFLSIPITLFLKSTTKNATRMAYLIFVRTIYGSLFFTLGFLQGIIQPLLKGSADMLRHGQSAEPAFQTS